MSPEKATLLLKALTIRQPWASAIASGFKSIEVRTWYVHYRGHLLIHAGSTIDEAGTGDLQNYIDADSIPVDPRSCYMALATLADIRPYTDKKSFSRDEYEHLNPITRYRGGTKKTKVYGWILKDIKKIKPIPGSGKHRVFTTALKLEDLEFI